MKKDQSSQSTNTGKDRGVNRRRFLSGVAIGAGLAPLATLSNSLWARRGASAASALCVGAASLAPTDLAYPEKCFFLKTILPAALASAIRWARWQAGESEAS
jgi:hypothetical protein